MPANPTLFSSLTIRDVALPNRIVVSPMCEYSSEDGFATDWHMVHLGSRAVGGAGLVMTEATAVEADGRITAADLGLWKTEHIEMLARITAFIKSQGAVAGIQLAHAGRKASVAVPWDGGGALTPNAPRGWQAVGPSSVPFLPNDPAPRELTVDEIQGLAGSFARAARRALTAGFDVIEIHGAHGYLIHEFLSPLSNFRTDEYGGSYDNRVRMPLEIVKAVSQEIGPKVPLFLRISASDWTEGGWTIDDSVELARRAKALGVDLIDTSSGGNVATAKIPLKPGYQVEFAARIRNEADILTGAVGMITTAEQAQSILDADEADLIFLARELLRDPYFPMHAAQKLGVPVQAPKQYLRAYPDSVRRG